MVVSFQVPAGATAVTYQLSLPLSNGASASTYCYEMDVSQQRGYVNSVGYLVMQ